MLKRLLGFVLAVSLFVANAVQVSAAEANGKLPGTEIQDIMLRILSSVEFEKESYGMGDVDFSSVTIGEKIPAYEVVDSRMKELSTLIFPVISNGTMISQFFAIQDPKDGEWYVQLDNTLVKGTLDIVGDQPFAYIYDKDGVYVYNQNKGYLLGEADKGMEEDLNQEGVQAQSNMLQEESRGSIDNVSSKNMRSIACTKTEDVVALDVIDYMAKLPAEAAYTGPSSAYLPVPVIRQPVGSNVCWAASCASIVNHVLKTHYTCQDIMKLFNGGNDVTMGTRNVLISLNANFSLNYALGKGKPSANKILLQLASNYPIFGSFVYGNMGHAVVIRGCDKTKKTFSMMDPGTNSYTAGSFVSKESWTYWNAQSGVTMTMKQHLFHN